MQNNQDFKSDQAAFDRIADTERHLRFHGASICDLFSLFDAHAGFDAFCDLNGTLGQQYPDPSAIQNMLQEIEDALAKQTSGAADTAAFERNCDASAALRWHGARISELSARFCHASGN